MWQHIKSTWFDQFKNWQKAILKILLCCVKQQIGRDQIETATDIETVQNSFTNTLNDLSIDETLNMSTQNTFNSSALSQHLLRSAASLRTEVDSSHTERLNKIYFLLLSTSGSANAWQHKLNESSAYDSDNELNDTELSRQRESSADISSSLFSLSSSSSLDSKDKNYVLMVTTKKQNWPYTKKLDANWAWSWDTFTGKVNLGEGINAQLWYDSNQIIDDDVNYHRFVNTCKGQRRVSVAYEQGEVQEE